MYLRETYILETTSRFYWKFGDGLQINEGYADHFFGASG